MSCGCYNAHEIAVGWLRTALDTIHAAVHVSLCSWKFKNTHAFVELVVTVTFLCSGAQCVSHSYRPCSRSPLISPVATWPSQIRTFFVVYMCRFSQYWNMILRQFELLLFNELFELHWRHRCSEMTHRKPTMHATWSFNYKIPAAWLFKEPWLNRDLLRSIYLIT